MICDACGYLVVMCLCVLVLLVSLSAELPLSPMNTEIWFLIPHGAKGDVLCLACSWETARDNGTKQRSKGNKQRELQRQDNSNNRQITLNEQGFFVEVMTEMVESVGTSTKCVESAAICGVGTDILTTEISSQVFHRLPSAQVCILCSVASAGTSPASGSRLALSLVLKAS